MVEAALLDDPRWRPAPCPPAVSSPAALPGELPCAEEWHEVAALLDRVAAAIPRRMRGKGRFSVALAAFVAHEVRGAAAEIRANLALEELDACVRARRHG